MTSEKAEEVFRLQQVKQEIIDTERAIQSMHRANAVAAMGGASVTATMKSVTETIGRLEHVFTTACEWYHEPNERNERKLRAAIHSAQEK